MLSPSLPCSLADLLGVFRSCFTTPTFRVFEAMVAGFLAQPGLRTVTGMLAGARLAGGWHQTRAHRFFSAARWSADQVGLALLEVIVRLLVVPETPLLVVVDDSLFKRAGRKVFGAGWHYDPTGTGRRRTAWGNNWVVLGVLVRLPFVAHRQVCLPVLARLWQPRQPGRSKLDLACALVGLVCARHPDRQIHLVADAAYAGTSPRAAWPAPSQRRPAGGADRARRAGRHPLAAGCGVLLRPAPDQGADQPGLPVVHGVRRHARAGRAGPPAWRTRRLPTGRGLHRPGRQSRRADGALRRPLER